MKTNQKIDASLIDGPLLEQTASHFRILSEPVRLRILNALQRAGELNVQQLVEAVGESQANVSKHLRIMTKADFVARRKDGVYAYYRITDPTLSAVCMLVCARLDQDDHR